MIDQTIYDRLSRQIVSIFGDSNSKINAQNNMSKFVCLIISSRLKIY